MNTLWMLMGKYDSAPAIDLEVAARDWLNLSRQEAFRAEREGRLPFPVVKCAISQKGARKVMLTDLATYIDKQAEKARSEFGKMAS